MKRFWLILLVVMLSLLAQGVTAQSPEPVNAWVTLQKFERGMMWWRSDTSMIWVLSNQGQVKTFPAATYSAYRDNRITSSPTGRVPTFGFGKVWGNFASVRRMIGSPTTGEYGLLLKITSVGGGYSLVESDGSTYTIGSNGQWTYTSKRGPSPSPTIRFFTASVSSIDGASLRSGSARIYVEWAVDNRPENSNLVFEQVFANGTTKNVELPRTNPIVGSSGQGVVAPVVPPNAASEIVIQLRLISLNGTSVYYTRQIKIAIIENSSVKINQFAGTRAVDNAITFSWDMTELSSARIIYTETATNTLTTLTEIKAAIGTFTTTFEAKDNTYTLEMYTVSGTVASAQVKVTPSTGPLSFTVSPSSVNEGGTVTVTWNVADANGVTIHMSHPNMRFGSMPINGSGDLMPTAGTMNVVVPSPYKQVTFMMMTSGTELPMYTVDVTCGQTAIVTGLTSCPLGARTDLSGAYQAFEHGFMIWLEGKIWVFYDTGSAASYADTWDRTTLLAVDAAPPQAVCINQSAGLVFCG